MGCVARPPFVEASMDRILLNTACFVFGLSVFAAALPAIGQTQPPTNPSPATSEAVDITLTVMAKGNGVPLSRVEIRYGNEKSFTNKEGVAKFRVPDGTGEITLYRQSFEEEKIDFAVLRKNNETSIYLRPSIPSDNEVIIRGAKRPEISRKNVSIEEAAKVAPGGDPAQVPKLLPGVQSSRFDPTIVVRGSGPEDSRYFIDDQSVPFIFHRIGNISIIPEQLLSDVEFSSGGFGPQYGDATGGVVTLRTKTDIPERPKTEFRINLPLYSSIYHERPLSETSFVAVSARRSYLEAFLPLVIPKEANLTLVPYFGDMHAYYYKATEDGYYKVLFLSAYDGLKLIFDTDLAQDQDGRGSFNLRESVNSIGVEWRKALSKDWSLTVTPQLSDTRSYTDVLDNRIHIAAQAASVHGEASKRLSKNERLFVGSEIKFVEGTANVLAPKPDFNDPFFDFEEAPKVETKVAKGYTNAAVWTAIDQAFGDFTITPGVRGYSTSQLKEPTADPRLSARYQLTAKTALKAAVGQYSEAPAYRDTDPSFGNPDLKYIRSYHYILGTETNWSDMWNTDFQGFYKETYGTIVSDPEKNKANKGQLISYGAEAFVRRNLTQRFFGWLSYTYSINRERDSKDETFRKSQYDQTHVANLVGNYKITGTWDAGGRLIYHTGETYTKTEDAVYNTNLDKYQPRAVDGARLYNGRLPPYHELDLFTSFDTLFDTWKLNFRFGVEALAEQRQANGVQYNYDYSEEKFFRGLPPIPYIEVRGVL